MLVLCVFCYKNAPQKAQTPITQASSRTRPFHCLAPSTTPISVKLLFLQLATSERCPDFSDEGFSLASHLFIPWGRLSLCHRFLEQHCTLFCFSNCLGDTQAPLENPCSPEPTSITPVLAWTPWSSAGAAVADTNTPCVWGLQ